MKNKSRKRRNLGLSFDVVKEGRYVLKQVDHSFGNLERLSCRKSSLELLTEHRQIDVKVDMHSLIAQASCAEQNGGNTV